MKCGVGTLPWVLFTLQTTYIIIFIYIYYMHLRFCLSIPLLRYMSFVNQITCLCQLPFIILVCNELFFVVMLVKWKFVRNAVVNRIYRYCLILKLSFIPSQCNLDGVKSSRINLWIVPQNISATSYKTKIILKPMRLCIKPLCCKERNKNYLACHKSAFKSVKQKTKRMLSMLCWYCYEHTDLYY